MADSHEIEIIIAPSGDVKMDVKGLKGPTCLTAIKKLADNVGELTSTAIKPEYYEQSRPQAQSKTKPGL